MDAEEAVNVETIVPGQDVSALKHDDASSPQSLQVAVDSQEISLVVEMNTDPASPEKTSIKEDNPEKLVFYQHDMQDITVTCDTHPEVLHTCKEELVSEGILDGTKEIGIDDSKLQLQEGAGKPHVREDANPRMIVFQVGDVEAKQVHGPKRTQICARELGSANLDVAFKVKGDTLPSEEDMLHASSVGGCRLINDKAIEGNVILATQGDLDAEAKAIINGANKINSAEQVEDVGRDFTQIVVEKEEELRSRHPQPGPEVLYVQKFSEHHGIQSREPVQDSCSNMEVEINASGNDFEKQQAMMGVEQSWRGHFEMPIRLGIEKPFADSYPQAEMMKGQEVLEMHSGTRGHRETSLPKGKVVKEEEPGSALGQHWRVGIVMQVKANADTACSLGGIAREDKREAERVTVKEVVLETGKGWVSQGSGYGVAVPEVSMAGRAPRTLEEEKRGVSDEANMVTLEKEKYMRFGLDKGGTSEKASQKRKLSGNLISDNGTVNDHGVQGDNVAKKSKKKAVNVWAKSSSRKGGKKNNKNGGQHNPANEDSVLITPTYVHPDKLDDGPDQPIALSKYDKAEKIELSENRLSASSTKGYRMVRATRGVQEGTWYFEIVVEQLGPTGHTRLGWSTQKGDVQAPVGFDTSSYGYRDVDGSKVHVAMREPYGDPYFEGDVIGFYIHLPNGSEYAPKAAQVISYRGRPYLPDVKDEHPQKVPGSEVCFFRNGICQGTAFKDINGGRYFPAASMYTLPKELGCMVRFNFGPDFCFPPVDLDGRPPPKPMAEAPYHNGLHVSANGSTAQNVEPQMKIL